MLLHEYMKLRMKDIPCNALTQQEADIFGIEYKKGWYINNKYLNITDKMLDQIKSLKLKNKYVKNMNLPKTPDLFD